MATETEDVRVQGQSKYSGIFRRMLYFLLLIIIGWCAVGCVAQRMVLWPRWAVGDVGPPMSEQQAYHMSTEVIWLNQDGKTNKRTEALFMKGQGVSPQNPSPVVIFAHGNGEVIDHWLYDLNEYRQLGISVLLVEFRGYGRSDGSPSEKAILRDFLQAYDLIVERNDVDPERIIVHGRSIGGGIAAGLAQSRPTAGLILQSTFTSVKPFARRFLIPGFLVLDPLDVKAALHEYDKPVLIMHGREDEIIPASHARQNFATLKPDQGTLIIFDDMSHNTPPPESDYWQAIRTFLQEIQVIQ